MNNKWGKFLLVFGLMSLAFILLAVFDNTGNTGKDKVTQKVKKEKVQNINDLHLYDKETLYNQGDPDVITMYLTVRRGNTVENTNHSWSEVNQYSAYDYEKMGVKRYQVEGLLQVGNEKGPESGQFGFGEEVPNATVQIRGQSSSRASQKNYKVEIKRSKGRWEGQRTINLNKHPYDYLRFRNKLAFKLIEGIPQIVGLRTQFIHLYVKDETGEESKGFEDYGIYTQVEQLNKTALEAHGLDQSGHLYKINNFEFYREPDAIRKEDDPKFDKKKFESRLEVKGDKDHTKLIDMLDKLNDESVSSDEFLEKYFDAQNVQYWMAFQILMGNIDSQNRNMFLYSPKNGTRWYILPWDLDDSLHKSEYAIRKPDALGENSWQYGVSNYWGNHLFQRLLKSERFRTGLERTVDELYKNQLKPENIGDLSKNYAKIVKTYLSRMPDLGHLYFNEDQYNQVLDALPKEVEENYHDYKKSLQSPQPFYIDQPKVEGKKLVLRWLPSYDFNNQEITYHVELAKDPSFKEKILDKKGIKELSIKTDRLPKGQYFIRVFATNETGNSQAAFDYYRTDTAKQFGVSGFYVMEDGGIKVDTYENR